MQLDINSCPKLANLPLRIVVLNLRALGSNFVRLSHFGHCKH